MIDAKVATRISARDERGLGLDTQPSRADGGARKGARAHAVGNGALDGPGALRLGRLRQEDDKDNPSEKLLQIRRVGGEKVGWPDY